VAAPSDFTLLTVFVGGRPAKPEVKKSPHLYLVCSKTCHPKPADG
jgi:hypothetical protein